MYGLSKIYKQDVSLRPRLDSIGSPTQALFRYLTNQLQIYGKQMTLYVKNADHFIDILHRQHVEATDMLASFDVTSLFTQVPISETVDSIRNKHQVEDHLINLIEHCLKTPISHTTVRGIGKQKERQCNRRFHPS
ncbi:hypothetical protein Trydic_g22845 [Trypoxylus dichotomus]